MKTKIAQLMKGEARNERAEEGGRGSGLRSETSDVVELMWSLILCKRHGRSFQLLDGFLNGGSDLRHR